MTSRLSTRHQQVLLDGLYSMYNTQTLTDVILQADDRQFACHRNVLAASSDYFRAMFTHAVRERDEKVISLRDVSPEVLGLVIGYMYTGNVELTNDNVQDIFMTATMFEMMDLIGECASHMIMETCVSNCVDIYIFASHYACLELKDNARTFLLEHFADIVLENDRILDLEFDDFIEIISSDNICVEEEETIYEAMAAWIRRTKLREKYLPKLFKAVRLPLLSESYVKDNVITNNLITNDAFCNSLISAYKLYQINQSLNISGINTTYLDVDSDLQAEESAMPTNAFDINTKPRLGMFNRTMLVFSGGAHGTEERSFTAFDPVTMKNYLGIKPHPTFDFKFKIDFYQMITTFDNLIYFLGGIFYDEHHFEDSGSALSDVLEYKPKESMWEQKSPMNTKRCRFSVCCSGSTIYVTGGKPTYPRGQPTDTAEAYDFENDYWKPIAEIPIEIYNHSSACTNDAMFLFGGQDEDDEYLDTIFRYDISRDSWCLVTTQMSKPRAQLSAFNHKTKIYLVGGVSLHENILTVAIYDPINNTWRHGEPFPEERKITSASFLNGSIFICGGVRHLGISGRRQRQIESRDLYRYDIDTNKWCKVVKLVQYGNTNACTLTRLNTKYLQLSEFVSSSGSND